MVTRRLGEQLEQERLELVVGAVDLVDEQHGRPRARVLERGEQRPRDEVVGAEQVVLGEVVAARLGEPDAEQLPRVVPLVQRLGGVDALVALQPDQRRVEQLRPAPWRPRSCRRRPRPRAAAAAAAGRRRTARWPARRRRGSRRSASRSRRASTSGTSSASAHVRRGYGAGSAAKRPRQPVPQNQTRSPSMVEVERRRRPSRPSCRRPGRSPSRRVAGVASAATGASACGARPRRRRSRPGSTARSPRGVRAPMSSPAGVWMRAFSSSVEVERVDAPPRRACGWRPARRRARRRARAASSASSSSLPCEATTTASASSRIVRAVRPSTS